MSMNIISGFVPNICIIMFDHICIYIYIETKLFDNRPFIYWFAFPIYCFFFCKCIWISVTNNSQKLKLKMSWKRT